MGSILAPKNKILGFLTRLLFYIISYYKPAKDYVTQMKFKPKPSLNDGFLWRTYKNEENQLIGQLFPQPMVDDFKGNQYLLDDILGNNFYIIIYASSPENFISDKLIDANKFASIARDEICKQLDLLETDSFKFCWIIDYPMYEINEETKKIQFSHNPFSMPQGPIEKLDFKNPLNIKAYQYDIVCNGIELSSGAIRNHVPDLMYKLFNLAGYDKTVSYTHLTLPTTEAV